MIKKEPVELGDAPRIGFGYRQEISSSQYDGHFCEIILKSDFKKWSYVPDTIMLQGHAVTLTFKVATQVLRATCRLNMVIIFLK